MYAVFEDGSRQYVVNEGDVVRLDYREVEIGDTIEFDRVLLYRNEAEVQIGQPVLAGARVVAEVIQHPSEKYYIQHFRRRKNYRRFMGHRQPFTQVEVLHILRAGEEPSVNKEQVQDNAGAEATGS
jgi:large subunit ribosomal protein L21